MSPQIHSTNSPPLEDQAGKQGSAASANAKGLSQGEDSKIESEKTLDGLGSNPDSAVDANAK
ncbi:hypothetical protein HI914_02096 [Erysiphe necator]|nr:hypothetical protein HI914_02096 [Erysiphe necator]